MVRKAQRDGDHLYCRVYGSEARLSREEGSMRLEATGERGDATALAPDGDGDLIGAIVADIGRYVL